MSPKTPPPPKPRDLFLRMKHVGYVMSQPPGRREDPTLADFILYARFKICEARGILFYDKIWEGYSDEQTLAEYYALRFSQDEDFRKEFEADTGTPIEDDIEWMERQIEENQEGKASVEPEKKPQEGKTAGEPEGFEETPDSLLKDLDDVILD